MDPPLRGKIVLTSSGLEWTSLTTDDAVHVAVASLPDDLELSGDAILTGAIDADDSPERADFHFDDGRALLVNRGSVGIDSPAACAPREVPGPARCEAPYRGVFGADAALVYTAEEGTFILRTGETTRARVGGQLYAVSAASVVAFETAPHRALSADLLVLPLID